MAPRKTPRKRPPRKGEGRPRKVVPDKVLEIIATLIGGGWSDSKVAKIVGVQAREWQRIACEGKRNLKIRQGESTAEVSFAVILNNACAERGGGLGALIINSMKTGIKKNHPWFVKLAIHNYDTGFQDPDVRAPRLIRRQAVRDSKRDGGAVDYLADPSLAAAVMPRGSVPEPPPADATDPTTDRAVDAAEAARGAGETVAQPGPIQDGAGGSA